MYYELNIDYIIETYCVNTDKPELQCNGKCYLSKQLSLEGVKDTAQQEDTIFRIVEAFYPLYFNPVATIEVGGDFVLINKSVFPRRQGDTVGFQKAIEKPPEFLI